MAQPHAIPIYGFDNHFPVRVRPASRLNDDELFELCQRNSELRIERTSEGEIIVTSPTGGETGRRNFLLTAALAGWTAHDGIGFDSSTGFILPNGAERAPDAAWLRRDRWEALTLEQALHATCVAPGWLSHDERRRGTLLPGHAADLVVLDRDPLACEPDELPDVHVVATMVAGRWVHNPPPWH